MDYKSTKEFAWPVNNP